MRRFGLTEEHLVGMRFAVNVALATTVVWHTLRAIGDSNPIWAIASMIAAADPQPDEARRMFRSRLINVAVGCAAGLIFLAVGGKHDWVLPLALAATVLVSSYVVRVKTMWRQAPITAAVVIAAALTGNSSVRARLWVTRPPGRVRVRGRRDGERGHVKVWLIRHNHC